MSTTHITPTTGRIVWYRGADGEIRPAIVIKGNGPYNADLYVFPLNASDADCGLKPTVTHADPEQEPGCLQSWHWMPYPVGQAKKADAEVARAVEPASALPAHQQRVIDEKRDLDEKLTKLGGFFDTSIFAALDEGEKSRLERQEEVMTKYSLILGERIAAFTAAAGTTV